ncbi:MAG: hypothetical protein MI919_21130 [Holophagales bacterium]|nr:hypothetical protein [Holophagales bacterium]
MSAIEAGFEPRPARPRVHGLRTRGLGLGRAERAAQALALGSAMVAQLVFVLGLLGRLTPAWVLGTLAVLAAACTALLARRGIGSRTARPRRLSPVALSGAFLLLPVAALAFYPPSSFDAGLYHLVWAERFVSSEALPWVPEVRYPVFPQLADMGFVLGLLTAGDVAAKLTQLLPLGGTAWLLVAWGRRAGRWAVGYGAAALWLGTPLVVRVGTQAYVDASLAFHVAAAVHALDLWRRSSASDRRGGLLVLAGLQVGFAMASKYLGLFFFGLLAAAVALSAIARARSSGPTLASSIRRGSVAAMLLVAAALAVAFPWYARIYLESRSHTGTGNPVFPFYTSIFGENPWRHSHDEVLAGHQPGLGGGARPSAEASAEAAPSGLLGVLGLHAARTLEGSGFLLRLPWSSVFERERFHDQAPLTPFYLLLLPFGVLALGSPLGRGLAAICGLFALFWTGTERDLRFLLPILPLGNLLLALGLARAATALERRGRRIGTRTTTAAVFVFLLPGPAFAVHELLERGPLPMDSAGRQAYLHRQVPGHALLAELERQRGPKLAVYGLYAEHLHYFSAGRFLGDWFGPDRYATVEPHLDDPPALRTRLRQLGVCFLLVRTEARPHLGAWARLDASPLFERRHLPPPGQPASNGFALWAVAGDGCAVPPY